MTATTERRTAARCALLLAVLLPCGGVLSRDAPAGAAIPRLVEALNDDIGIPRHLDALRTADIPELAKAACWEADTNYPVPRYMSPATCESLLREILPPTPAPARARRRAPVRKQRTK